MTEPTGRIGLVFEGPFLGAKVRQLTASGWLWEVLDDDRAGQRAWIPRFYVREIKASNEERASG